MIPRLSKRDVLADVRFCEECGEVTTGVERARRRREHIHAAVPMAPLR